MYGSKYYCSHRKNCGVEIQVLQISEGNWQISVSSKNLCKVELKMLAHLLAEGRDMVLTCMHSQNQEFVALLRLLIVYEVNGQKVDSCLYP